MDLLPLGVTLNELPFRHFLMGAHIGKLLHQPCHHFIIGFKHFCEQSTNGCFKFISKHLSELCRCSDFTSINNSCSIDCSEWKCIEKTRTRLKREAKHSYYNHCEDLNEEENSGNDYKSEEVIILKAKEFLINQNFIIGRQGYDANIGNLYVKTSEWSKLFEEVVELEHFMMHLPQKPNIVVHVTSHQRAFFQQQIGVLWSMLSSYPCASHQVYFIHSPVVTQDSQTVTIQDYSRRIHEEVESALIHKYGKNICGDESGSYCLETLTETKMIFDILRTGQNQTVKLHLSKDHEILAEKGGCFVQYNCARLAMLFQHHQKAVDSDPLYLNKADKIFPNFTVVVYKVETYW
ncbi:DALR anticodon-binding domain-containing protein 3-like [Limulus polyphemus]|uniref:DALR anticodon-binding domain-containing protein 3-like n=1 Tax=Limulus polyphemus TaxID=6850 RepID=A0ABM1TCL7_LIMPO|nr:DALR anticodon-binding domain-containing protein 3-like [Limulus polyphemus]